MGGFALQPGNPRSAAFLGLPESVVRKTGVLSNNNKGHFVVVVVLV